MTLLYIFVFCFFLCKVGLRIPFLLSKSRDESHVEKRLFLVSISLFFFLSNTNFKQRSSKYLWTGLLTNLGNYLRNRWAAVEWPEFHHSCTILLSSGNQNSAHKIMVMYFVALLVVLVRKNIALWRKHHTSSVSLVRFRDHTSNYFRRSELGISFKMWLPVFVTPVKECFSFNVILGGGIGSVCCVGWLERLWSACEFEKVKSNRFSDAVV